MPDPYGDGRFGIDSDPMNYPGGETGAAAFARENRGKSFIDDRNRSFWDVLLGRSGRPREFAPASGPPVDVHPSYSPTDEGRFPPQVPPPRPAAKPATKLSSGQAIADRIREMIRTSPLDQYASAGPSAPAIDWNGTMPPQDAGQLPPYDLPPYMRVPYADEDLRRVPSPYGNQRFGGNEFGGRRFGGNEFGGHRFGGNEFGASARRPEIAQAPMPYDRPPAPTVRDLPPYDLPPAATAPYSEEDLRRPVTPYGGQRFGGREFGGNKFGGNLFGGRLFGPQAEAHADGGPIHMMRGGYPELYDKPVRHGYFATGGETNYVGPDGRGDGRSDHIDAKLSPGEYVIDAETTSLLGDGDGEAGARKLDKMRQDIRRQKGKKLAQGDISPKAKKSAVEYLARDPVRDGLKHVGR